MNSRLQKLRKLLAEQQLDAILISSLHNITYLTSFSGFSTEDRDAYLLITQNKQYIFTHGLYKEAVEQHIKNFILIDITRENPISSVLKKLVADEKISKLGFEAFDLKVDEYDKLTQQVSKRILVAKDLISILRIEKDSEEIDAISKACKLGDKAFAFIYKQIKIGISEQELATELDFFIKRHGADTCFSTIVAFGENASKPHHVPTPKKLTKNTLVLFDFGVRLHDYCSDMTRTLFFGKATNKQKTVYETVSAAQDKAVDLLKSLIINHKSIKASEIDLAAREYIISNGFPSIPHTLGHGIGLNVHESPRLSPISKAILTSGMVFSIEPGIYLPGEFGVRIEDLFAIKNDKLIQLTNAPKELIEM